MNVARILLTQPWSERSPAVKRMTYLMAPVAALVFCAFFAIFFIEKSALDQPQFPDAIFKYAHEVRSTTRYYTALQEDVYVVAKPLTVVGFLILFGGVVATRILEERRIADERKARMDKIAADM